MKAIMSLLPLGAALLGACSTMTPSLPVPDAGIPAALPAAAPLEGQTLSPLALPPANTALAEASLDERWRKVFTEPGLQKLIELGLNNNRDARVAMLNVERARALYQVQDALSYPSLDARGSETRQRTSDVLNSGRAAVNPQTVRASIGFSAYELDVFGRIRSLNEEALARFVATEYASDAARISLIAELANSHANLDANQARLALAQSNVEGLQKALDLVHKRKDLGVASELDVSLARSNLETARIAWAQAQKALVQNQSALAVLVGGPVPQDWLPGSVSTGHILKRIQAAAEATAGGGFIWPSIPTGVPSDVLLRRPDLRQSENLLKAANARIGAARAAFFPSISLTAETGRASTSLDSLFDAGTRTWLFTPEIRLPIFDGGRNQANLRVAQTDQQIALAQYEKAIQTAFREVRDALAEQDALRREYESRRTLILSSQRSLSLAEARFAKGIDNYLTVIESQRQWIAAQQGFVDTQLRRQSTRINLFKALGAY